MQEVLRIVREMIWATSCLSVTDLSQTTASLLSLFVTKVSNHSVVKRTNATIVQMGADQRITAK